MIPGFGSGSFGSGEEAGTFENLGFEVGANGFATRWEIDNFVQSSRVPGTFVAGAAFEDFSHGWATDAFAYTPVGYVLGITEGFELGWSNTGYMAAGMPVEAAAFGAAEFSQIQLRESFERGWSRNEIYKFSFDMDPDVYDVTDEGRGPLTLLPVATLLSFTIDSLVQAVFSGARALAYESFEHVKTPVAVTADDATDTFTSAAHGLAVGYRVLFATTGNSSPPSPIGTVFPYYVQSAGSSSTFMVSIASGGPAVDITDEGAGVMTFTAPYENWVSMMATI